MNQEKKYLNVINNFLIEKNKSYEGLLDELN